ncbi:MAG: single-stranded DNA-binding protein [Actinobacteria bacterium]|nr:MAG: single-stranded DNA-binding protein [Actinomycetota bacterium]
MSEVARSDPERIECGEHHGAVRPGSGLHETRLIGLDQVHGVQLPLGRHPGVDRADARRGRRMVVRLGAHGEGVSHRRVGDGRYGSSRKEGAMVTVNVVVLAGSVAADPVQRRMPSGDEVTELRLSVPEAGKRLLPLPIAAWHATVGVQALDGIAKGDRVLVHGQLVRRFYRSGAGARSLTEVVASGIKKLEEPAPSG